MVPNVAPWISIPKYIITSAKTKDEAPVNDNVNINESNDNMNTHEQSATATTLTMQNSSASQSFSLLVIAVEDKTCPAVSPVGRQHQGL